MEIKYRLIRSNRKRLSLEINESGLTIRAPKYAGNDDIRQFIMKNESWIIKNLEKYDSRKKKYEGIKKLSIDEIRQLAVIAKLNVLAADGGKTSVRQENKVRVLLASSASYTFQKMLPAS